MELMTKYLIAMLAKTWSTILSNLLLIRLQMGTTAQYLHMAKPVLVKHTPCLDLIGKIKFKCRIINFN